MGNRFKTSVQEEWVSQIECSRLIEFNLICVIRLGPRLVGIRCATAGCPVRGVVREARHVSIVDLDPIEHCVQCAVCSVGYVIRTTVTGTSTAHTV